MSRSAFWLLRRNACAVVVAAAAVAAAGLVAAGPVRGCSCCECGGAGAAVPGSCVVVLRDAARPTSQTAAVAQALAGAYGGQVTATWQRVVHGFAARMG